MKITSMLSNQVSFPPAYNIYAELVTNLAYVVNPTLIIRDH